MRTVNDGLNGSSCELKLTLQLLEWLADAFSKVCKWRSNPRFAGRGQLGFLIVRPIACGTALWLTRSLYGKQMVRIVGC